MKKFLLTGIALSALVAGPAMAADLAVKAPIYKAPPPVPVYFSWTGCYIGGHIGGLWARKEWTGRDAAFGAPIGTNFGSHDADSWLGGVQAGCDYQFAGGFVIGIQGDYAWTDAHPLFRFGTDDLLHPSAPKVRVVWDTGARNRRVPRAVR
jgi:outer membrane immunogenic protein